MTALIDTHAHLTEYDDAAPAVEAARRAGLSAVVAVGLDIPSNEKTLALARQYPGFVYPAIGWYPAYLTAEGMAENLGYIEAHINEAVAVGEIGLDYLKRIREEVPRELQQEVLGELLALAQRYGKPAVLHTRYAWKDALSLAAGAGLEKAVFHYYSGPSSVLKGIVEAGYYVSVPPAVEYNEDVQRVVRDVDLDHLLLETDCPFIFKKERRDEEPPATPADVARSLAGAAAVRGISGEELAAITSANARRLFGIP